MERDRRLVHCRQGADKSPGAGSCLRYDESYPAYLNRLGNLGKYYMASLISQHSEISIEVVLVGRKILY